MVGKAGDTDKQGQAERLHQVPSTPKFLLHIPFNHVMVFQVVSAVVEELLQPKLNGLKAKAN